jgi:hypothetical protein
MGKAKTNNTKDMRNYVVMIILFLLLLLASETFSQTPSDTQNFTEFNAKRDKITRNGMYVLGGWALANMVYSGSQYYQSEGTTEYFHQMNVIWNSVNVALVGGSLLAKAKNDLDFNQTMRFQMNTEKMFIANAALDLVYTSAGLYLTERAKTEPKNYYKYNGWGQSLMLQGGFLFLFDSTMYGLQNTHGKRKLYPLFNKVSITTSGLGLRIGVQL